MIFKKFCSVLVQTRNKETMEATLQQPQQQEINYCYETFIGTHMQATEPKSKSFTSAAGKQTYHEIPVQYNYGTPEAPIIDSSFIEFPIVTSRGGINCKKEEKPSRAPGEAPYMKESYSMMFIFDLQDEECVVCLEKIDSLHSGVAHAILPFKTKIGLPYLDPKNPEATGLKHPVYYKRDQLSNERVKGRNPSIWVKMNHWKNNKTLFTDLNGNIIDWGLLYDVEVKMIPLIHVEKVYSGATTSIQMKMVSAVITDIAPINTRSRQTTTLSRLKQKYSGLADTVASQLAEMRMNKQDQLDGGEIIPQNASLPGNNGQMHRIPTNNSGAVNQQQLNEFLGGAPAQSQVQAVQYQAPVQTPIQLPVSQVPVEPRVTQVPVQQPQVQVQQPQLQQVLQGQTPVQFSTGTQVAGGQAMLQIN